MQLNLGVPLPEGKSGQNLCLGAASFGKSAFMMAGRIPEVHSMSRMCCRIILATPAVCSITAFQTQWPLPTRNISPNMLVLVVVQVTVAVMDDSTVAVEVAASQALLQWPYLTDMSLINAVASVFVRPVVLSGARFSTLKLSIASHRLVQV